MISECVLFKNEFLPVATWYQSKVYSKRVISEWVYWGFHSRTKRSFFYLYNINAVRLLYLYESSLGAIKSEGDRKWVKMLVVPLTGQKNQRPSWYVLGCFSLNKTPEISITRTILMIWLEPLEHIDQGIFIFGIFQFFCFRIGTF